MDELTRGLYESLMSEALAARLETLEREGGAEASGARLVPRREALRPGDAADRLAWHLARVLRRALDELGESGRVEQGVALAARLVEEIARSLGDDSLAKEAPRPPGEVLRALLARRPDGEPEAIAEPLVPLVDTTLLTNARGEPNTLNQLQSEIESSARIDLLMAFIRRSGLRPLRDALARHVGAGRGLRVLTTTYTSSTEAAALDELVGLGARVRVSYDLASTRLHAKAWLFHRPAGFSTAYVGSSNLTHSAQVSGQEWNLRIAAARNPDVFAKMAATFESWWQSSDFIDYEAGEFRARVAEARREGGAPLALSPLELRLEPFQERLLEELALARSRGRHANLLVSATGTGKTVMAAVDYQRLRARLPRARLLFVAHRKEILEQSLATFRHALREPAFGELWVGGRRPELFEHVFASIQSVSARGLAHLDPAHFDVVIVDEFHHAAAESYRALLARVAPRELLGLTATPERSDGLPILEYFGGRIAAELRLWDAIEQQRLVPFVYYGIADDVDLRQVRWVRGRGYDVEGLSGVLTADERRARFVLQELVDRAGDPRALRVLGFCVSVEHARFMARVFAAEGVRARAVWGDSPRAEREAALKELASGELDVLFSVDLFNEGVDLPDVDTLLFLRPTDSPLLFLQQLGRGLRRSSRRSDEVSKTHCTVLDFVGRHREEFRFDRPLRALLGGSRRELVEQLERGFPFLPAGCHMQLDRVAAERVLASIKAAVPSRWQEKADELRALAKARGGDLGLAAFLEESGLELDDVYGGGSPRAGWSDLREAAGLPLSPRGPEEDALRRALGRLRHVDDAERIEAWRALVTRDTPPELSLLDERARRLVRMLVGELLFKRVDKGASLEEGLALLWSHPQVRAELAELLALLEERIDHLHAPLARHPEVPLAIHARYKRTEILAACGVGEGAYVEAWQTGVRHVEGLPGDLLAFTLDKSRGHFSPTTRYRDYAISPTLIHWESQNSAHPGSETGRRYIEHAARGSSVFLFARETSDTKAFWFLGPARYRGHESERPMAITWELEHALPGDLFAAFAAAVA